MADSYEEFIRVTREHQAERERLKRAELKRRPELAVEEYYTDISQVNTLVEDNLVPAPEKNNLSADQQQQPAKEKREESLIKQYGGREAYERIHALEMSIDEHFKNKCQQLKPPFWPVIPINLKPYLNQQR